MLKEAKALARARVVARFAKQEVAEAGVRAAREAAQQEVDFTILHQQVSGYWLLYHTFILSGADPTIKCLPYKRQLLSCIRQIDSTK